MQPSNKHRTLESDHNLAVAKFKCSKYKNNKIITTTSCSRIYKGVIYHNGSYDRVFKFHVNIFSYLEISAPSFKRRTLKTSKLISTVGAY